MALVEIDTRVVDGMEVQVFENEGWRRARRASDRRSTYKVSSGSMLAGCQGRYISSPDAISEIEAYVRDCKKAIAAYAEAFRASEARQRELSSPQAS